MSKSTKTRSTKIKEDPDASKPTNVVNALRKVFFISEQLLHDEKNELVFERFFHPGKGRAVLFIAQNVNNNKNLVEVLEYSEPRRSWLINSDICSNGRIYLTTPVDVTFLALHHLRKHCTEKALALDSIHDDQDGSVTRLLTQYVRPENLTAIADVKVSGDMRFYKYNAERTIAWLAVKTRQVVDALQKAGVHCGLSALSQNYTKSEKNSDEATVNDMDYLRVACGIIGEYLDLDLHEQLIDYLKIPSEIQAITEEKAASQKRKSLNNLKTNDIKKIKLNSESDASSKLKNSSLLDASLEDNNELNESMKPTPLKERTLSAKEKALAKGAKGSKSIASFFKK